MPRRWCTNGKLTIQSGDNIVELLLMVNGLTKELCTNEGIQLGVGWKGKVGLNEGAKVGMGVHMGTGERSVIFTVRGHVG